MTLQNLIDQRNKEALRKCSNMGVSELRKIFAEFRKNGIEKNAVIVTDKGLFSPGELCTQHVFKTSRNKKK